MKGNQERPMLGWATMKVHYTGDKCSRNCAYFYPIERWYDCFKYNARLCEIPAEDHTSTAPRCERCIEEFGGLE